MEEQRFLVPFTAGAVFKICDHMYEINVEVSKPRYLAFSERMGEYLYLHYKGCKINEETFREVVQTCWNKVILLIGGSFYEDDGIVDEITKMWFPLLCAIKVRVGVAALVFDESRRVLIGRRLGPIGGGSWQCPGGFAEENELPLAAAKRELFEETGLLATKLTEGPWVSVYYPGLNLHVTSLCAIVKEYEGTPTRKEPNKCEGWEWFSVDFLPEPLFYSQEALQKSWGFNTVYDAWFKQ